MWQPTNLPLLAKEPPASSHPLSFLGDCVCLVFFWHKLLAPWPSQALQAPLKGSVCLGTDGESRKYHQGCKKNQNTQLAGKYKQGLMKAFAEDMASPSAAKSLGSGGAFPSSLPQFPPASPWEQQSWCCHVYCVTLDTWGRCREPGRCFPIPFSFLCASKWLIVVCYDLFVLSLQPQVKHLEGRRTRP